MDAWDRLRAMLPETVAEALEAELKARAAAEDTGQVSLLLNLRRGRVMSARVVRVPEAKGLLT
jgi:hypothetical protein